eukprot:gene13778-biopygen9115
MTKARSLRVWAVARRMGGGQPSTCKCGKSPEKSGRSPGEVRKKSGTSPDKFGMIPGSGMAQSPGKVWKRPGKVRNGPGPLSDDRSDPRLCPMTNREWKANADTQGRPEEVRKSLEKVREKSGKVRKSPEEVRKSPGKSGKVRNWTGAGCPVTRAGARSAPPRRCRQAAAEMG